jgi:AAA ATPase domain
MLGDAVRDAVGGVPRAVVVHGEAGIGKTRLAREVAKDPDLTVLWGSCVHFGAASVPFAPIIGLLQDWRTRAGPDEQADVLDGIDGLGALLPSFGGGTADTTRRPRQVRGCPNPGRPGPPTPGSRRPERSRLPRPERRRECGRVSWFLPTA